MNSKLSRFFAMTMLLGLFGLMVVSYQNCQSGGSTFAKLAQIQNCVPPNCTPINEGPNPDHLTVMINDFGTGIIETYEGSDTLTIDGSCVKAGFPTAYVKLDISRGATALHLQVECIGGFFSGVFGGIQTTFNPTSDSTPLLAEALISGMDQYGAEYYNANRELGYDHAQVNFVSYQPTTTTRTTTTTSTTRAP